jgi:WD40 repeat protein
VACLRLGFTIVVGFLLFAAPALAAEQPSAAPPALYDRPVLAIDPGMHTSAILDAAADAEGRWAVTGSGDKTVRVWSLADGALLLTIRLPAGPGDVGKAYSVAMSPDGALIAAGGWTRWTEADRQQQIYLFDRASGALRARIDGLPDVVFHLNFSPDGNLLAAMTNGEGLRIYARDRGWAEVARDVHYGWPSYGAAFAPDGRLATTEFEGKVRLYAGPLIGHIRPTVTIVAPGGARPVGVAFGPDGSRLAVGHLALRAPSATLDLLDGHTLAVLPGPSLGGIEYRDLAKVAWSTDGRTLFAAGRNLRGDPAQILVWGDAGAGAVRTMPAGANTVFGLVPLPLGDLLVAAADPSLARLQSDGGARWVHGSPIVDLSVQDLSVSSDGTQIDFGFARLGKMPARFDVKSLALQLDPPRDGRTAPPRRDPLKIEGWLGDRPTLAGRPLPLEPYDTSHSVAIHPAGDRFVLGTSWSLNTFDASGTLLWRRSAPSFVWAVNITGDGRLIVAAYGDGTIRWHRMTDGGELLAFMPLPDRTNWVAWTPEGFYAAIPAAHGILRWHVNRGWDPAASVAIEDIPGSFRPAMLPLVLQEMETPRALGLAALAEHNREIMIRTDSHLPPGTSLHLLAIGISAYNEDYARNLRLQFADRDARDLASAIANTQESLYADVKPQVLLDKDANKGGILRALKTMRAGMEVGGGDDLAVVYFSGHGALVDGKLYLLPYEVDARDDVGIKTSGLVIDELRGELLELAKHGRVLVLLDACHSGATTMNGATMAMDSTVLRAALAAANVTVLTSSTGTQVSREDPAWEHGAFTKALLDAFNDPTADINHNSLISTNGLAAYLTAHVASLTGWAQTPGMEIRYDTTLFATGFGQQISTIPRNSQ